MENLLEVKLEQKWIFESIRWKVYDVWNTWYLKIIEWDWKGFKKIIQGVDGVTRFNLQNCELYCTNAEFYYNCFILQNTSKALKRETKLYKNLVLKQNGKFTIKI